MPARKKFAIPISDEMRAKPLDEFIAWMLKEKWYRVDVATGRVWNARSGQELRTFLNASGYPSVNLVFCRSVVRRALVHRIIAIAVEGADAVRGKQVAHLDQQRSHSVAGNLWIAPTAAAHIKYDGTDRNLTFHAPSKESWLPCVRCGDPDGSSLYGLTPDRITGSRFGIEGSLCRRCYGTLQERERRARQRQPESCHGDVLAEMADRAALQLDEEAQYWMALYDANSL